MAAYGGNGWSPRRSSMQDEIGVTWGQCGISDEWSPLKAVLLHRPGVELENGSHPNDVQMLAKPDPQLAIRQHDALVRAYEGAGVRVDCLEPPAAVTPNQMFVADLMLMTPEGAIVARPASTVRAGEERWVARKLANLGIPILRTVGGRGVFEGADAAWIDNRTVLLGRGLRTNPEGARQVSATLADIGVSVIETDLPRGSMHLMGILRFADRDLALAWPRRLAQRAIDALQDHGYDVAFIPEENEARKGFALNFVTLGPRQILMPAGNPSTRLFYESLGIDCRQVEVDELIKAAGAVGCLTGVLQRDKY
ncbi:MAG: amidinotransferase [Deltaproteobacteria bacterium SG8_13]|nr:MAG: amidinotransferase [Deltaproteobacteria bacterium SG8_13]